MPSKKIWCSLEGGRFPRSEFVTDPEGNLIHRHLKPHYITGVYVNASDNPADEGMLTLEGLSDEEAPDMDLSH